MHSSPTHSLSPTCSLCTRVIITGRHTLTYAHTHEVIAVQHWYHIFHWYRVATISRNCRSLLQVSFAFELYISFAKETYKTENILQKRHIILRSLLIVATPYHLRQTTSIILVSHTM